MARTLQSWNGISGQLALLVHFGGKKAPITDQRAPPQTPPRWWDLTSQVSLGK
jgi:hypothetical protein